MAFARHPIFGLLTYVAVFYLHPPSRWWGQGILLSVRWALISALVALLATWLWQRKLHDRRMPRGLVRGILLFVGWMLVQWSWSMNPDQQLELTGLFAKYALLVWLIYRCVDSVTHLKYFLWTHVLGCFYLGWIVFTTHIGGRFEGFGGPGIQEANTGAMQLATGVFTASALLLAGKWLERAGLLVQIPFVVNGIIATVSRSATLAFVFGGLVFNLLIPRRLRWLVRALSILAVGLFVMLTSEGFWERMDTLKYGGERVEGKDTGGGRLEIIAAQWRMFEAHPFGCGHRCTIDLSRTYLPDELLTGVQAGPRGRASHNTLMTMLVEHGIPGGIFYFAMVWWTVRRALQLSARLRNDDNFLALMLPAVAATLAAILIGDQFVDYLKLEVRFWFMAILMVMLAMTESRPLVDSRQNAVSYRQAAGR